MRELLSALPEKAKVSFCELPPTCNSKHVGMTANWSLLPCAVAEMLLHSWLCVVSSYRLVLHGRNGKLQHSSTPRVTILVSPQSRLWGTRHVSITIHMHCAAQKVLHNTTAVLLGTLHVDLTVGHSGYSGICALFRFLWGVLWGSMASFTPMQTAMWCCSQVLHQRGVQDMQPLLTLV